MERDDFEGWEERADKLAAAIGGHVADETKKTVVAGGRGSRMAALAAAMGVLAETAPHAERKEFLIQPRPFSPRQVFKTDSFGDYRPVKGMLDPKHRTNRCLDKKRVAKRKQAKASRKANRR